MQLIANIIYVYGLYTNSQDKCGQISNIFCTTEWLGCKHYFERFVFELVVDGASDLMTHSCRSSGGSPILLKALSERDVNKVYCIAL